MKDYIYLDNDFLNSSLAQYEQGLIRNISQGKTSENSQHNEKSKNFSKGVDGILGIGAKLVHDAIESNGQELTKGQSKTIDYVLNDYAVDLLIQKVKDYSIFKDTASSAFEGDFISQSSEFKIYDFDLISKISAPDNLDIFKSELTKGEKEEVNKLRNQLRIIRAKGKLSPDQKEEIINLEAQIAAAENGLNPLQEFEMIYKGANFANQIFCGSLLIKTTNAISICKRNCFRLDQAQLSFLTESERKIVIFGVVTAIKEKTHSNGEFKEFEIDELNKVPNMFHDIFLSNFGMLHDNDRIIKPIAIFFE
ncbi:DUF6414 family protein [Enterococcus faecalis]|uniref:DUF6414 family protein n=1 Tax=Enterococcus faecalis TaxID=1351 RepID=UPI0017867FEB|nr:hypothetical protein [Enterococcus faecalis]MBD9891099.1 hypothetical protein [Enterococcus faecalis]